MGVYYQIINPVKRQYLNPNDFGEAVKWEGLLRGGGCIEALKLLLCDHYCDREASNLWDLAGSWVGDPTIISADDISQPNPVGLLTTSDDKPARNLYLQAKDEFYNISHLAVAMICERGHAEEIIQRAENDSRLFVLICDLLMQVQPPKLKRSFDQHIGPRWTFRYDEYIRTTPWHQPLPIHFKT